MPKPLKGWHCDFFDQGAGIFRSQSGAPQNVSFSVSALRQCRQRRGRDKRQQVPKLRINGRRRGGHGQAALIGLRLVQKMHAVWPDQDQRQYKHLQDKIRSDRAHERRQRHMRCCYAAGYHQGIAHGRKQKGHLQCQQQAHRNPDGILNPHQQGRGQNRNDDKNDFEGVKHKCCQCQQQAKTWCAATANSAGQNLGGGGPATRDRRESHFEIDRRCA